MFCQVFQLNFDAKVSKYSEMAKIFDEILTIFTEN